LDGLCADSIVTDHGLDSLGIESLWGRDFPCRPDWPPSPPSTPCNAYQFFTVSKTAGPWC